MKLIYIVAIAAGSVFIVILALLLNFVLFRKKRYIRQVKIWDEKYNTYHTQLYSDCKVMIGRLGALGKYNIKYQNLYNERKKQYDEIILNRDSKIQQEMNALHQAIANKDYKKCKVLLSQTEENVSEYCRSVSNFNEVLTNLLRDDSDTSEASLSVKEKYRKIKSFYEENKTELKPLEKSFNVIFQNADDTFKKYTTLNDQASFEEAKKLLPPMDQILSALIDIMDDLPNYEILTETTIPQKLESLKSTYSEMVQNGYDLTNLRIPEQIREMNSTLESIKNQLQYLDVRNVKERLENMQSTIADILVKFDCEKKAREKFSNSQEIIQTSTYTLEKEYSKHMNRLSNYAQTYVLDQNYVTKMKNLKNDIESISYLKRELDGYIDTSDKQPYSLICNKMEEMQKKIDKVRKVMSDYATYLESLKSSSQSVYIGLRDYYILLKKARYQVKTKIAVSQFSESLSDEFKSLFDEISRIDNVILHCPIDVMEAKDSFAPFASRCDSLVGYINKMSESCKNAEIAIVYANAYRVDYTDSRPMLEKAEKAFYNGSFDKAKEGAMQVLNAFNSSNETFRNN